MVMDWGVKQFPVDVQRDPTRFRRVVLATAGLHMAVFSGLENLRDKYFEDLFAVDTMAACLNVLSQGQEVFLTRPQAKTRKMVGAVKQHVWACGGRAIREVVAHTPGLELATLTPESFAQATCELVAKPRRCPGTGEPIGYPYAGSRLVVELEYMYDFLAVNDAWTQACRGCEAGLLATTLDIGLLMWSTLDSETGKLRHPKKAEEWLSDVMVLSATSPRVFALLADARDFTP